MDRFGNNVRYVPSSSLSLSAPSSEQSNLSVFPNPMSLIGTYSTVNRIFHICQSRLSNIQINCYLIIKGLLDLFYVTQYKNLEKYIKIGVHCTRHFESPFFCGQIRIKNSMLGYRARLHLVTSTTTQSANTQWAPIMLLCKTIEEWRLLFWLNVMSGK